MCFGRLGRVAPHLTDSDFAAAPLADGGRVGVVGGVEGGEFGGSGGEYRVGGRGGYSPDTVRFAFVQVLFFDFDLGGGAFVDEVGVYGGVGFIVRGGGYGGGGGAKGGAEGSNLSEEEWTGGGFGGEGEEHCGYFCLCAGAGEDGAAH